MDTQKMQRCLHYQIYSEPLDLEGPPAYIAIRRCMLSERLIGLLNQSPDGERLADKLVISLTEGKSYAFVGPDLDAVTQRNCTVNRCESRCTPAYGQHLQDFSIVDPQEEVTCTETEDDERREASSA
jgi:hypothetical protein